MNAIFASMHIDASYFVAALLVGFYAASRFNTPRTVRSQTSRFQYFGSCAIYVASCEGLLMVMTWLVIQKPDLLGFLHLGSAEQIPDGLKGLDVPLVGALMLTTLLPSFPVLRDVDAAMLGFFHKMGAIPFGAVRWAQRMDAAQFTITQNMLAEAKTYITNSKLLPDTLIDELELDFSVDRTRFRFTRCLALYVALGNLQSRARFADDFPDDVAAFEKKMTSFFTQCVGFLALTSQLSREQLAAVSDSIEKFRSLTLEAYDDLRLMLARMLLYSSNGDGEVAKKLTDIGFAIKRPTPVRMPFNLLSFDIIGVVVLFAGATLLSANDMPVAKAMAIGLLVAVNHSIAAAAALLPKQVWSFADIRCAHERPVLAYIISGILALTISLPVSYCFYLLRMNSLALESGPVMPFPAQCKWLLMSSVMAAALAFACDDLAKRDRDPAWLRWAESVGLAGLMAFAGWLAISWLQGDQAALHPHEAPPPLWAPVLLSASIGALFGATIPNWYRKTMRQVEAARIPVPHTVHDTNRLSIRPLPGEADGVEASAL